MSVVKLFLRSLREGRIYIARVTKGGRNGRYAYLLPPIALLNAIGAKSGTRFRVVIFKDHVDYIIDEHGDYTLTLGRGNDPRIRFPLDVFGYVIVEPLPRGFRVYF